MTTRCNRRAMLAGSFAAGLASLSAPVLTASESTTPPRLGPLCLFAKHLQWLSSEALTDLLVELDVAGIEATVRAGGQVAPAEVRTQLPELAETLARRERRIVIMTTDITSPESPHATAVLETAAKLGITHYRMGYYHYDLKQPILPQLEAFTTQAQQLAELNRELGLTGLYQNHAGDRYLGAPIWDLRQLLASIPTEQIAVAYDVRHATVEGGLSWPLDWALIRPHVGAFFLKDFRWEGRQPQNVPLGSGSVSPQLFAAVRDTGLSVPVSLHMEYIDHRRPELIEACVAAYRADREATRKLIGI